MVIESTQQLHGLGWPASVATARVRLLMTTLQAVVRALSATERLLLTPSSF